MRIDSRGWRLDASPEVLRAIEALPLLVEALRGLVDELIDEDRASSRLDRACYILAQIDER